MMIQAERHQIQMSSNLKMGVYMAYPTENMPIKGKIFVFQEAFGVNPHIRQIVDRLAHEGFMAMAPDFIDRFALALKASMTICLPPWLRWPNLKMMNCLKISKRCTAGLENTATLICRWQQSDFVWAGGLRLANAVSLVCSVSFYGYNDHLLTRVNDMKAPMLFFWGGKDAHLTQEKVRPFMDTLKAAGNQFINVEYSDAEHGFFCDARASFNPKAAASAWPFMLNFINQHL